jgi:hypothetical protein
MKIKFALRSVSVILFLLVVLFPFVFSKVFGADWKFFSESEGTSFFYDADSISWSSGKNVSVGVKAVVSEKDRLDWVNRGGKKYLDLRYIKSILEIDCADKRERSLSLELLSEQGILDSFHGQPSEWSFIPPGSNWDNLYKAICR